MTKTATMKKGSLPTFNQTPTFDKPLPILFSCRIRLSEEKRALLKKTYYEAYNKVAPQAAAPIGNSKVTTVTSYQGNNDLDIALGMNRLTMADIFATRDSLAIGMVLNIQKVLNIELITQDELREAFEGYLSWTFRNQ